MFFFFFNFGVQKFPDNPIIFFFKIEISRQPNFTPFQGSPTTKFHSISGSPTNKFHSILCPRQLLWSPLEGWGKTGALQKVSLPKLRNTGAPSTNWGALLYCEFYTVQCTVYTLYWKLYTVNCTLYTVNCILARGLKMKSLRIHLSSSNFSCVTQTENLGPSEIKLDEFFLRHALKLFR